MAVCFVDISFRRQYPETIYVLLASSTDKNADQSATQVGNTDDGYVTELQKVGQNNVNAPGTKALGDIATPAPYSTRLRPLTDLNLLINKRKAFLEKIEVWGYDPTLDNSGAPQTQSVLDTIYNSRATNDAYAQALTRNGMMSNWQPNYCRPEFWVNSTNIIRGLGATKFGNNANKGDLSIGVPLPYCFDVNKDVGIIRDVQAYGQLAQYVAGNYQRYMLLCMATFWM
jgi:hypothetical protein